MDSSSPTTSSHCWVCDDRGALYVLKSIHAHSRDSYKWTPVGSGFKGIYGGYNGLLCGIKDSSLHVRKNVFHNSPEGAGWVKHPCDVLTVIPGKNCIVRKSSRGSLHVARVGLRAEVQDWNLIPPYSGEFRDDSNHYVVDSENRLFCVTGSGTVSCCELLSGDFRWETLASPPPLPTNRAVSSWLSSLWGVNGNVRNGGRDWVRTVSAGVGCLWCLREGSNEVWQLVIGQLNGTTKANWVKFELSLSDDESVIALAACRSSKDRLYTLIRGEGYFKMVSFSLSSRTEDCGRVEIELPVRYPCWALSICSTQPDVGIVKKKHIPQKRDAPAGLGASPPPKRAKESTKDSSCLLAGVPITCSTFFTLNKFVEVELPEVPTEEEIAEEFQYDFSMEREIIYNQ